MIGNPITQLEQLTINTEAKSFLKETAKWAFFLSIIGFIGIAFLVVLAIFSGVIFSAIPQAKEVPFDLGLAMTIVYLLFAVLYFFPVYYLMQFSNKMKKALATKDDTILADAFKVLKSHYKFIGVFTIIILSLYAMLIVVSVVTGSLL
ncbi:hypothetical protein SAMN05216503_1643 [Polaribacter sp. KT25b]|uniref:DUF5362 family protein n=1 Tax=Polaribacter sp. KT25b TaxID=1855336 RepID=UPI00087BF960|nr:DUF5362 family protein [Polaribacter sp. KT25b]SDR99888.1 hypothetical protein SAMN05216503_1643 [Polaribacter sp. KT25b]